MTHLLGPQRSHKTLLSDYAYSFICACVTTADTARSSLLSTKLLPPFWLSKILPAPLPKWTPRRARDLPTACRSKDSQLSISSSKCRLLNYNLACIINEQCKSFNGPDRIFDDIGVFHGLILIIDYN